MTDDHRRCDDLFAAAEQAMAKSDLDAARKAFAGFHAAMRAHFGTEESTLFPAFEERTGMSSGPTQVMRAEHQRMVALMDDAAAALVEGRGDDYLGLADTLLIMMQQHNMKEENILYPMCDQHLGGEGEALLDKLKSDLARP